MTNRCFLPALACLALGASDLHAQMMGGGREARVGREVMNERLANAAPGQREVLDAMRDERAGASAVSQRLTLRAGLRSYALGSAGVSEAGAQATYSLRTPRFRLRVTGGPLRFASGDTTSIVGLSPVDVRFDLALRARDTLRVGLRAPSSPMTLTGQQVAALASVATATVDLASVELGTPAGLAARYTSSRPLGAWGNVSAALGVDYEPRPSDVRWSYWRGTTLRAGIGASGDVGGSRLTLGLDLTRSFGDSLGGRNLFQGGGTVLARIGVARYLGTTGDVLLDFSTFYFRPFAAERSDAPNRRIPVGDFVGASALGIWSLGELLVTPTVVISRESSHVMTGPTEAIGSGWALATSLAVDIPVGTRFGFTPELGYAGGSLSSQLNQQGASIGRTRESLSGWWLAADISLSF